VAAILFLTIFSFQLLPVEMIGKILWSGQMTEEVHEHSTFQKNMPQDKLWYLHFSDSDCSGQNKNDFKYAIRAEALIKCYHLEVLLQPPNFC
jgi:hypothetical protein